LLAGSLERFKQNTGDKSHQIRQFELSYHHFKKQTQLVAESVFVAEIKNEAEHADTREASYPKPAA
jgi:hypothetical protein